MLTQRGTEIIEPYSPSDNSVCALNTLRDEIQLVDELLTSAWCAGKR